jgi:MFS family permease
LFRQREILTGNAVFALLGLGAMQLPLVSMMLLQQPTWTGIGLGVTATIAGLAKLPSNLTSLVGAPLGGYMYSRWRGRAPALLAASLVAAAWLFLFFCHDGVWQIVAASVVATFAIAIMLATVPNIVLAVTPEQRSSEAAGLASVTRAVSQAIGAQVVMTLLATSTVAGASQSSFPSAAAYSMFFAFAALTAVIMGLVCLGLAHAGRAEQDAARAAVAQWSGQ